MNSLVDITIDYIEYPLDIVFDEFVTIIELNNDEVLLTNLEDSYSSTEVFTNEVLITEVSCLPLQTIDSSNFIKNEIPIGIIDGINAMFQTNYNFIPGSVELYLNGVRQKIVDDFQTIGSDTIQFLTSPTIGENILVDYIKL